MDDVAALADDWLTMIPATLSGYTSWWNRRSSSASQSQVQSADRARRGRVQR
jgi:uncharacterized iron-regulated membrane protein